jgi:catechol 2,3-dioxygenase-like lactoylglutathione lyase family enzyme
MTSTPLRGGCLCGNVQYALTPPTDFAAHCHCNTCRRASGAAFLTWTSVPNDRFELVRGGDFVSWYRSSETINWGFCSQCGTTLFYRADVEGHAESPRINATYVTVASLDDPLDRAPSVHVSFEEHVAWLEPNDRLPKHVGKTEERIQSTAPHFILYVADQARSTDFYRRALGAEPMLDVPGMTQFALSGATLGLMPDAGIRRLLPDIDTGDASVCRAELYLPVDDVAAWHDRALEAGAVELSSPSKRNWGDFVAYCRDPDGHILAFSRQLG